MPMRVDLTEFCQDFTAALRPLSHSLDRSIVSLHDTGDNSSLRDLLSAFVDVQHRLKILSDKAEQQHAYLLIFGPLKSGKSTLMNAISGAYVSEVSSLPAYPCLVYVHEGEKHQCSVTRFDGTREDFKDEEALQERIQGAHAELAAELRRADLEQRTFNPATDYPQAIRRVDFTLPAPNLRQSGTILVDTPGLYTKMRYNYEQLTRDFRHNAACAVFVVKTDNLFFDQVFDEFKDLLGVFSRIFLVVNVDSSKQDLSPHGQLQPSLESRDPRRVIQAFEDLTVSAQMRAAIDDGRLRIYLIDLLRTAQRSLAGERFHPNFDQDADPESNADSSIDTPELSDVSESEVLAESDQPEGIDTVVTAPEQELSEAAGPASAAVGFEAFLRDLTQYLNSSGYIVEFMADSLRQCQMLIDEIEGAVGAGGIREFRDATDELKRRADDIGDRLKHLDALEQLDWEANLEQVKAELDEERRTFSESTLHNLQLNLRAQVEDWFQNEDSLRDLVQRRLQPAVADTSKQLAEHITRLAEERFRQRNSGLKLDAKAVGHLHKLGISLDDVFAGFPGRSSNGNGHAHEAAVPPINLQQDRLPVRKGFIDWITFRSPSRVRRRILGENDPSEQPIPAPVKEKRLGDSGKAHLLERVDHLVAEDLRGHDQQALEDLVETFRSHCIQAVRARLSRRRNELQSEERDLRRRHEIHRRVNTALDALVAAGSASHDACRALHARYVATREGSAEVPEIVPHEEQPEGPVIPHLEPRGAEPPARDLDPGADPERARD